MKHSFCPGQWRSEKEVEQISRLKMNKSKINLTRSSFYVNLQNEGEVFHIARNIRIKVARAEKDMTQKALAEAVGISRQTMNAIEQGEFNPTIRLCRAICRVLGKKLDDLFGEENEDEEV